MAFTRRSAKRRKFVRVVIVEHDADQRALLGEGLSGQDFAVDDLSEEQVLHEAVAPRRADVIVLGPSLSTASALSFSARLSAAGVRAAIVNLAGQESARAGCHEVGHHGGAVLRIDDMLKDLEQLVHAMRKHAHPPRGDVVHGALTLRQNGATLWNDVEVPLTPCECAIVSLLVRTSPQLVPCNAIYALGKVGSDAAVTNENGRRIIARLAVSHIQRKFRDCDPEFHAIQSYRGLGYVWNDRVRPAATASEVIHWSGKR